MTDLHIRDLHKTYGATPALRGVGLDVPAGALLAVLGPSGCGKTTLLRCIAGFEHPDSGHLRLGDRVLNQIPTHRRGITVVSQEPALFPHLTAAANIGYGLPRTAGRSARIEELLELTGLHGLGKRMPHQLSGGQQQRVAVARALAPHPAMILLDEPFSALDTSLRTSLRQDVRQALHAANTTAVIVTHDQDEALSTADTVAVMHDGRIVQTGTPQDIYLYPATAWTAGFLGDANLLDATFTNTHAVTILGAIPVTATGSLAAGQVCVRPEQIVLRPGADAVVVTTHFHGHDTVVTVDLPAGVRVTARTPGSTALQPGDSVALAVHGNAHPLA